MRVAVTGASGNVGTSLLAALRDDPQIEHVTAIARRKPSLQFDRTSWHTADVSHSPLAPLFDGADAVVHLAWLIQPSRDEQMTAKVNVHGTERVLEAVAEAKVPAFVYASSIGAYAPGPSHAAVDESWPTTGVPSSFYSRQKAATERLLDNFESSHPDVRVVRLRPALIFKRSAATEIRRLFAGPLLPNAIVRPGLLPILPLPRGLRTQAVHSLDVGEAYRLAVTKPVRGAFNIAADPVLDAQTLGRMLGARPIEIDRRLVRAAAALSWRLRLQPTSPGWLDMGLDLPLIATDRARQELGFSPRFTADRAIGELLRGMREGAGLQTPPLSPATSGPLRWHELRTGVGARSL